MLQRTGADRVAARFTEVLGQFPTPEACAAAGPAAVVRAWIGLGHTRRAVLLHRTAVVIATRHSGRAPIGPSELADLPGIGPYTARAVMAFAFGADVAAVDTNVERVVTRAVLARTASRARVQLVADRLVPPGKAREWNQALFDLGAMICTAGRPRCQECPFDGLCAWQRSGGGPPTRGGTTSLRAGRGAGSATTGSRTAGMPDPWRGATAQGRFEDSDRQGRGRLVATAVQGGVAESRLGVVMGWPDERDRAEQVAAALVAEGLLRRDARGTYRLA